MLSGTANNAGAILVVGRGLVVVPKLIHPLPPPLQSPETSPERTVDDTWMQVRFTVIFIFEQKICWLAHVIRAVSGVLQELNIQRPPTPTRGRPQPDLDRNSLAYIWCDLINVCILQSFNMGIPCFFTSLILVHFKINHKICCKTQYRAPVFVFSDIQFSED